MRNIHVKVSEETHRLFRSLKAEHDVDSAYLITLALHALDREADKHRSTPNPKVAKPAPEPSEPIEAFETELDDALKAFAGGTD